MTALNCQTGAVIEKQGWYRVDPVYLTDFGSLLTDDLIDSPVSAWVAGFTAPSIRPGDFNIAFWETFATGDPEVGAESMGAVALFVDPNRVEEGFI